MGDPVILPPIMIPTMINMEARMPQMMHPQVEVMVMSEEQRKKQVRPLRSGVVHSVCGTATFLSPWIAETMAANPKFYGVMYCNKCGEHHPVNEFTWVEDGSEVGR